MDSKATIYAERTALTDVLRKAFTNDGLDNVVEIFKRHSNICIDLTDAELDSIFKPTDLQNLDDLFTIFSAYDIYKNAKSHIQLKKKYENQRQ